MELRAHPEPHILTIDERWCTVSVVRRELSAQEIGLEVRANLTNDTVEEFRAALYAELEKPQPYIVLDMENVRSINSAALGAMLLFQKKAREKGKGLRISRCSVELRQILRATRLDQMIEMLPDKPTNAPR
jgi:anti-anti-sigma factor